ncbi:hypothetical protein N665_0418s0021 [Sinapis alba]|nr:hypothetical protein N665_0418s0021 [Sinapis alba]
MVAVEGRKELYMRLLDLETLLNLRSIASTFIKGALGNGETLSFWTDSWSPLGPLINLFGEDGPRELGIPLMSKVAKAVTRNSWSLPAPRSDTAVQLHAMLTTISPPLTSAPNDYYSLTWDFLRPRQAIKSWASTVWFKGAVPKQACNMWLANLNRLTTRSRLVSWGMNINKCCCLCSMDDEDRDHLFLKCSFSSQIWDLVLARLTPRQATFISWAELLSWCRISSLQAPETLRKLLCHGRVIYHIWRQRNKVFHNNITLSPQQVFKLLDRDIRNTITARQHKRSFSGLMAKWIR